MDAGSLKAALRSYQLKLHSFEEDGPEFIQIFSIVRTPSPQSEASSHDFDPSLEIMSGKCAIPRWVVKNTLITSHKLFLVDESEEYAVATIRGTLQRNFH